MPIEEVVNVQITRETTAVSQKGFGILMIIGETNPTGLDPDVGDPRVLSAASIDDVILPNGPFQATDPEAQAAAAAFAQEPKVTEIKIGQKNVTDVGEDWVDALALIREEDDDWYGTVITTRTKADVLAVADAVETLTSRKIFGTSSNEASIIGVTDASDDPVTGSLAAQLKGKSLARTFLIYHEMGDKTGATQPNDPFADAAWIGKLFPTDPGSATWAFKTLSTVPPSSLTTTESGNVRDKNANTYETLGGVNITREGTMSEPEFIDVIRGVDFIQARMTEAIFGRLVNLPKIPYTDAGTAIIEGEVNAILNLAIDQGILTPDPAPIVNVGAVADQLFNDRANRVFNDIDFSATLAGAIHSTTITGTVSV